VSDHYYTSPIVFAKPIVCPSGLPSTRSRINFFAFHEWTHVYEIKKETRARVERGWGGEYLQVIRSKQHTCASYFQQRRLMEQCTFDAVRLHSPLDGFMSSASRDANHPNCHTLQAYYSDPTEG